MARLDHFTIRAVQHGRGLTVKAMQERGLRTERVVVLLDKHPRDFLRVTASRRRSGVGVRGSGSTGDHIANLRWVVR